jgi:hypothetical protein
MRARQVFEMDRQLTIVGIYEPETGARMMIPLQTMQEALGAPGMCLMFLVKCEMPEEQEVVARRLLERIPDSRVIFTRERLCGVQCLPRHGSGAGARDQPPDHPFDDLYDGDGAHASDRHSESARRFKTVRCDGFHQGVNAHQRNGGGWRLDYRSACASGARILGRTEYRNRAWLYALRGARLFGERFDRRDLSGAASGKPGRCRGAEL